MPEDLRRFGDSRSPLPRVSDIEGQVAWEEEPLAAASTTTPKFGKGREEAMKRIGIIIGMTALMLVSAVAVAQQPPAQPAPQVKAEGPPIISGDLRAAYFKADGNLTKTMVAYQQAQGEFQRAIAELTKTCGEKYMLQAVQEQGSRYGDPVCVPKPPKAEPKPEEAPKK